MELQLSDIIFTALTVCALLFAAYTVYRVENIKKQQRHVEYEKVYEILERIHTVVLTPEDELTPNISNEVCEMITILSMLSFHVAAMSYRDRKAIVDKVKLCLTGLEGKVVVSSTEHLEAMFLDLEKQLKLFIRAVG